VGADDRGQVERTPTPADSRPTSVGPIPGAPVEALCVQYPGRRDPRSTAPSSATRSIPAPVPSTPGDSGRLGRVASGRLS
jgi:hypothetical protein